MDNSREAPDGGRVGAAWHERFVCGSQVRGIAKPAFLLAPFSQGGKIFCSPGGRRGGPCFRVPATPCPGPGVAKAPGQEDHGERDPQGCGEACPRKKTDLADALAAQGGHPVKRLCETLGVARSNIVERRKNARKPRGHYVMPDDGWLLPLIRELVDERPTYGYRRIHALVIRRLQIEGKPVVNHKRVYRLMKQNGLLLARHTGKRPVRQHDGKVITLKSTTCVGAPTPSRSPAGTAR